MKRFLFWSAAFCLWANMLGLASASLVLDQNQGLHTFDVANFSQPGLAQSFQQESSNIAGAGIYIFPYRTELSATITISLYNNLPTQGGKLLVSNSGSASGEGWFDVHWAPHVLTPSTTMYLVFTSTNSNFRIGGNDEIYSYGQAFANDYSSYPNYDYAFRTYTETAPVPLPAAVWLLGTGVIGLVTVKRKFK